jgi:small subunit ribosomal protein S13
MARIAGIELPRDKRIDVALRYIYGIGIAMSKDILENSQVRPERRVRELTEEEVHRLQSVVSRIRVEGDLRREVSTDIKRLIDVGCYRGTRHQKGLPVRGQRTRTNARTRKGPRKTVGVMRGKSRTGGGPKPAGKPPEGAAAPKKEGK